MPENHRRDRRAADKFVMYARRCIADCMLAIKNAAPQPIIDYGAAISDKRNETYRPTYI